MNVYSNNSNFPSDVLKWMKKNATPRMSVKLMQICKYFQQPKFPYFVIKNLHGDDYGWQYQTLAVKNYYHRISLKSLPDKLWIIGDLNLYIKNLHISVLMANIVVCDVQRLCFIDQKIAFEDFKILTAGKKVEVISLEKSFIRYENGEAVPLENIFSCLPNVKLFGIFYISNSFSSAKEATKNVPLKLKEFRLSKITQEFKLDECLKFVMRNQQIYSVLDLDYPFLSDQIKAIVNEIIKNWSPNYRPLIFLFMEEQIKL